jgi:plastocyanin
MQKLTLTLIKGETTWTIKLKAGRYTYQCDPHAFSGMKGHFRVTA